MPLGIVSDTDFAAELERLAPSKSVAIIIPKPPGAGRTPEKENTPESIRKTIATEPLAAEKELAALFNVGPDSVSAYKNGATSCATYNEPNKELKAIAVSARERIAKKARNRLTRALDHITEDKLSEAKLSEVSAVARDMATIVKNMEPAPEVRNPGLNAQFVFFAPQQKRESDYDTIVVNQ